MLIYSFIEISRNLHFCNLLVFVIHFIALTMEALLYLKLHINILKNVNFLNSWLQA